MLGTDQCAIFVPCTQKAPGFEGFLSFVLGLIQAAGHDSLFDIADGLGNLNFARAGHGTVENGVAAIYAKLIVENLQAIRGGTVAAVEDEAMGVDDGRGADIFAV